MKERRPSGEPMLAEVGPPVILSLGIAGYFSVIGHAAALLMGTPSRAWGGVRSCLRCRQGSACAPFSHRS